MRVVGHYSNRSRIEPLKQGACHPVASPDPSCISRITRTSPTMFDPKIVSLGDRNAARCDLRFGSRSVTGRAASTGIRHGCATIGPLESALQRTGNRGRLIHMTIQRYTGMTATLPFRDLLRGAVGLPVVIELTNIRLTPAGDVVEFDAMRFEEHGAGMHQLQCQWAECGKTFFAARADAKYDSDNCRLRAHRAAKRAEVVA